MLYTKAILDDVAAFGCQMPGCDHKNHDNTFFLHARCHPAADAEVSYTAGSGVLKVACRVCSKVIAEVKVAEE